MATYKESGVNVEAGDRASVAAYKEAMRTFAARKGMIGMPVAEKGGFGGMLDMGDHYLVVTSDGTGSKMSLALALKKYDSLGFDLTAMVSDDMICTGAETVAIANTFDVPQVYPLEIEGFMKGLAEACAAQRIVIPAGEIAEVPSATKETVWNATAIGIVAKDRVIDPVSVTPGDVVVALRDTVARSNGFSLVRHVLGSAHGDDWPHVEWKGGKTWGEIFLAPSVIYSGALLTLLGRFGEERKVAVKALAHITGGGIPSKLARILRKSGRGAALTGLFPPHDALKDLITLGKIPTEEAYRTWHMGQGMLMVVGKADVDQSIALLAKSGIEAKVAGEIVAEPQITLTAYDGEELKLAL